MIKINSEDFIANALIESIENYGKTYVSEKELVEYKRAVLSHLKSKGIEACCAYREQYRFDEIMKNLSEYFVRVYSCENGPSYVAKESVTLNMLWERFRGYLSCDVMDSFGYSDAIQTLKLRVNKTRILKK